MKWRHFVCLPMVAILPVSVLANDVAGAMLRSNGIGVLVNKSPAPTSIALFPNDLIETQENGAAHIEASGSTADINPATIVQFGRDELVLEHGTLSVNTSRGLKVRVGCLTVTPVNNAEWTHYDVVDVDGKVTVSALRNDVAIDSRSSNLRQAKQGRPSSRVIVREGEQKSRQEKCGAADYRTPDAVAATGAVFNSPWLTGAGLGAIGGLTCWALCRGDDPISPSDPSRH